MWARISSARVPDGTSVVSKSIHGGSRRRVVARPGIIELERTPTLGSGALRSVATDVRHPLRPGARARRVATPARLATWFRGRALGTTVVASVMLVLAVVHASGLGSYPAFFDDEGTYVARPSRSTSSAP